MKYAFVIITLTGLLLQTFSKGLIWAEYMANKSYIARELCENKARPELACNGQCYMMKQMEQESKKDQSGNALKDKYEVVIAEMTPQSGLQPYFTAIEIHTAYHSGHPIHPLHAVFHPPQA